MGPESNNEKEAYSKRNAETDSTQTTEETYREEANPSKDGEREIQ